MSEPSKLPSSAYVFVVVSLAAFLTLFTIWRKPAPEFVARVDVPLHSLAEAQGSMDMTDVQAELLDPECILQALVNSGMLSGDAQVEMLKIANEIAARMRLHVGDSQSEPSLPQLSLRTQHPDMAIRLLDQLLLDRDANVPDADLSAQPATAQRIKGAVIPVGSLVLLMLCSLLVGTGGLMLLEQSQTPRTLLTKGDVVAITKLPVVMDFTSRIDLPERTAHMAWKRRFRTAVRVAEVAVAAAILLMVYNVITQQAFVGLLVTDPLAAYSEALGRML